MGPQSLCSFLIAFSCLCAVMSFMKYTTMLKDDLCKLKCISVVNLIMTLMPEQCNRSLPLHGAASNYVFMERL